MSTAHEVPQRLFNLLSDHESCVDKVNKQLDSKTDSKMVHRFQEKNFLTFKCMFKYEKWLHSYEDWVIEECKVSSPAACFELRNNLDLSKQTVKSNLRESFARAITQEETAFNGLTVRVQTGTKLVAPSCPFMKNKVKLPED